MRREAMALWRSMLGLSVLALMLVGCDATPHSSMPTHAGAQTTATTTPTKMLDWRKVSLPPGIPSFVDTPNAHIPIVPVVSPVNGRHAWVCAPSSGTSFQVWFTQDAGATWRQVSTLTPAAPLPITSCSLTADQSDADALAANFAWSSGNEPSVSPGAISYYSSDDGANWRQMPQSAWVSQVATVGDATYAMLLNTSPQFSSLVVSADHLATWHRAQQPPQIAHAPFQFWAAPTPGNLLLADRNGGAQYSDDAGASWEPLSPPQTGQVIEVTQAAWQAQTSGWLVCGYLIRTMTQQPPENLCTSDLGTSWTVYPALTSTWECGHCSKDAGPDSGANTCLASAIAAGGALYAICGNDPQDSSTPPTPWTISRLSPGASVWTTLGLTPCQSITMTQTGQAWCFDDLAGRSTYMLDQLP